MMRACDIIARKGDGLRLNAEEIDFMVQGFVEGDIPDYQMSAFLMAAYIRGLNEEETIKIHANNYSKLQKAISILKEAIIISDERPQPRPLVCDIITENKKGR